VAGSTFDLPPHWFTDGPRKRSVKLSGHTTSISLEQPFWDVLRASAAARGLSLNVLIGAIDQVRAVNLSSALRVFALREAAEKGPGSAGNRIAS
jgi:predicted DNA-binding ribbon-helix-helix protein